MRLGEVANADAREHGKPLDGVRVLAIEQMQSLPFATQLLGRLGADVVKVESPHGGDQGRSSLPALRDPAGRRVGATFALNNLSKRSLVIDLKARRGRELLLRLAPRFDVVAENFKAGTAERLGLGYHDVALVHPSVVYLSVSGFGNEIPGVAGPSPYRAWPAYAAIVEAMSGIYELKRPSGDPPTVSPVGGLGDIGTALFAVIGVLAALRHRERTGDGQQVDVAMLDAMLAMTDLVTGYSSLDVDGAGAPPMILDGFRASDGWFVIQVGREAQFGLLARIVGSPEWLADERLADRAGWARHLDLLIRPAVTAWAASRTALEACRDLTEAGIAAGPCFTTEQVVADPHVAARDMLVEWRRDDGVNRPVLIPGNPIKLSRASRGPEQRVPWLGEHTDAVLRAEIGLSDEEITDLRADRVIA